MLTVVGLSSAFLCSVLLVHAAKPVARRFSLVDCPGGRKQHEGSVPLVGGVALMLAFWLNAALFVPSAAIYLPLFLGLAILLATGVLDDLHELAPRNKLLFQFIAAVLMTSWGGIHLRELGDLFGSGSVHLQGWGIPITLFATLSVINAYNMCDGIDGLAGGWSFITLVALSYLARAAAAEAAADVTMILASTVAGFLVFNLRHPWRKKASVFLGDAGSMTLGFAIVWFSIELTQTTPGGAINPVPPVVMLWVLGLVLLDMFSVTVRRVAKRRNPLHPDRTHLHHVLLRMGFSDRAVVLLLLLWNLGFALIGIVAWKLGVPDSVSFGAFLVLVAAYIYASRRAWRITRMARRLTSRRVLN